MGNDATAILFYGYCFPEEGEELIAHDDEWSSVIAKGRGIVDPWDEYYALDRPSQRDYQAYHAFSDKWIAEHDVELNAWHEAKRKIEKEMKVDISYSGSDQAMYPYIYVTDGKLSVEWGENLQINSNDLTVEGDWDDLLIAFINELKIDITEAQGPGWFLVAFYG